jgi:hypothetical protein
MRLVIATLTLAVLLLTTTSAQAGRRQRYSAQTPPNRYQQNMAYGRAVYPRYYGSIHARQIQNIGVPTGDIGLRGNGITLTPW